MYRSHPVRRMCRDPIPDAVVTLLAVPNGEFADEFETELERIGGSIDADLGFDAVRVRIPETQVQELCSLAGLERVETAAVVSQPGSDERVDSDDEAD